VFFVVQFVVVVVDVYCYIFMYVKSLNV